MNDNTCDRCGAVELSQELVWITAEGFKPKPGEVVPEKLYKKYDALCEPCYLQLIKGGE